MDCRTKAVMWCYQLVDFCSFNRETVAIAMNIFDRFILSTKGARAKTNRSTYQLAAMTALYTAVKVHEPEAMEPLLIANISGGNFNEQEIETMEAEMLQGVLWRVNPPTALAFVRLCLDLIDEDDLQGNTRQSIYEMVKVQTELAVFNHGFIAINPSILAYCCLMNVIAQIGIHELSVHSVWGTLTHVLAKGLKSVDSNIIADVQLILFETCLQRSSWQE